MTISDEYYIQLIMQEPGMWKHINYDYFCEELFPVKNISKHSCENAIFFYIP